MTGLYRELTHIVDIDGQLIGIDEETVDPATLLRRHGARPGARLLLVQGEALVSLEPGVRLKLTRDQVSFFVTEFQGSASQRLAA